MLNDEFEIEKKIKEKLNEGNKHKWIVLYKDRYSKTPILLVSVFFFVNSIAQSCHFKRKKIELISLVYLKNIFYMIQ